MLDVLKVALRAVWRQVTTAWRVLRLRIEERPPMWKAAAAYVLNKHSRTADKGYFYSLEFWRGTNKSSPRKLAILD
jgi:hypothetical protein